jgi:protein-S-isoprenylcysteine O-methyltransferase Ste14
MTETDRPNILILPPLAFAIALAVALALEYLAPLGLLPPRYSALHVMFGAFDLALSFALAGSAILAFQKAGTNVHPTHPALKIVENGPYRLSRNPMYLGILVMLFGLGLIFSLDWAIVLTPVLWAVLHFGVVKREESYLEAKFGEAYTEFRDRTRRWI